MSKIRTDENGVVIDAWGVDHSKLPTPEITDYHKDEDDYIIEYQEVEHVKMNSDKDTDFTKTITVEEFSRVKRQDVLNEQSGDVGIINILKKMALSGDESLLNQTHRISMPGIEKDALGRAVEDIVDVSPYQVDKIEALASYKKGAEVFKDLDPAFKGKKSLEDVAKLSDADIDAYIKDQIKSITDRVAAIRASSEVKKEGN